MRIPFYQVDAFTQEAFKGNPAAICILSEAIHEQWMQNIAAEMNLSETAFLIPKQNGYLLRWFTPQIEVDLCGHATLASAHVLWENAYLPPDLPAIFHTKSETLTAKREGQWIELNFPREAEASCECPAQLMEALGIENYTYIGKNRLDYFIELDTEEEVRALRPNYSLLSQIQTRGVIVTSHSQNSKYDFVSRSFFPSIGVNEDPVTGSAHCCLGPYWKKRIEKNTLIGYQASKRGGLVKVTVKADRVLLGGQAITVMKGEIL